MFRSRFAKRITLSHLQANQQHVKILKVRSGPQPTRRRTAFQLLEGGLFVYKQT